MKRRVGLILLLLVAGAIVNVAVAWGCAALSERTSTESAVTVVDRDFWVVQPEVVQLVRPAVHDLALRAKREHGIGIEQRFVSASRVDRHCGEALVFGRCVQLNAGWPIICLSGQAEIVGDRWTTHDVFTEIALARHARLTDPPWQAIPLRPLWPGFAINTLFYAGILWLLFAAPFALRRRRRIKRGLCPACGYDLRGRGSVGGGGPVTNDICPECGAPHVAAS